MYGSCSGVVRLDRQCQKSENGWYMSIGESQAHQWSSNLLVKTSFSAVSLFGMGENIIWVLILSSWDIV